MIFDMYVCPRQIPQMKLDWVFICCVNVAAGLLCYMCARTSAKLRAQRVGYALPLLLSTPVLFALLITGCESWNSDPCQLQGLLPGYIYFKCYR